MTADASRNAPNDAPSQEAAGPRLVASNEGLVARNIGKSFKRRPILRGVSLLGVASAGTARDIRGQVWDRLADDWKPCHLERICTEQAGLDDLDSVFARMMAGESFGRTLVKIGSRT